GTNLHKVKRGPECLHITPYMLMGNHTGACAKEYSTEGSCGVFAAEQDQLHRNWYSIDSRIKLL
ncbi:hypothetical protein, partial [Thiolapillus sp.]|uniref:hypothetical protein n=2 Tax=Thiolapillus sp. TaxID=2017437 RepID=UPI003AF55A88